LRLPSLPKGSSLAWGKSTLGPERDPTRREDTLMGYQLAIVPARG
jgi:hypothetical protein